MQLIATKAHESYGFENIIRDLYKVNSQVVKVMGVAAAYLVTVTAAIGNIGF